MKSQQCRRAVELGAVSGSFNPEDMATALGLDGAAPVHRTALWRELSTHVTEVLEGGYGWQLKPDARHAILQQLVSRAQVRQLIDDAPKVRADDNFCGFLRDLLTGREVVVATSGYARNSEDEVLQEMRRAGILLDAVQFAQSAPASDADALDLVTSKVKRHIAELRQRRDLLIVLPRRHFGYEAERRILSHFLRSLDEAGQGRDLPVFLSGIGGVGKSALHARLFQYWQQRSDGPLTVTLDFDRRQLNSGAPVELLKEFLRQCAVGVFEKGFPPRIAKEVGDGLSAMRYGLAEIPLDATFDRQMSGIASTHISALSENWAAPLRHQPIAIAFDSFEALDRRGGSNVEIVLRLERVLRSGLPLVRSVFAGREEPLNEERMTTYFGPATRRMRLTGITPEAGAQLIKEEDARLALKRAEDAQRAKTEVPDDKPLLAGKNHHDIAAVLKGHPLAMLMLVQFAHARPMEIDRLLAELDAKDGLFEVEFAQVFLYERILERISNREVRALAHPGLVLRQLNTDLIREVLAVLRPGDNPAETISEAEAERLKAALAREYWLVETDTQGFDLRHRPDLRRLMMPGLFAKPREDDSAGERAKKEKLTASAIEVCARAARYFREGPPEEFTEARARWHRLPERLRHAHGFYYGSFVSKDVPDRISINEARDIQLELGEDLGTMPLEWRAVVHATLEKHVSDEEKETLNDDLFEKVQSNIYLNESKVGRSSASAAGGGAAPSPPGSQGRVSAAGQEREIADAFARCAFDHVAGLAEPYLHTLADDDGTAARRFDALAQKDVTLTPLWKILLVAATQDFGLADLDPEMFKNGGASFSALAEAVAMLGKSGVDNRDIRSRVALYVGDVDNPHAYRQSVFNTFSMEHDNLLNLKGSFAALALVAAPMGAQFRPDAAHPHSVEFLALAQEVSAKTELKLREIQALYDKVKLARFHIDVALFPDRVDERSARVLRGLSPELYDPLISALRDADPETLETLEQLLKEEAANWPVDLRFDPKTVDETAPLIVETADRYGLLRHLAQVLALRQPDAQRVVDMHDAMSEWFFEPLRERPPHALPGWVEKALV